MSDNHYKQELSQLVEHLNHKILDKCVSTIPDSKSQDYYKGMYDAFHLLSQYIMNGTANSLLPQVIMAFLVASQRHIED